MLPRAKYYHNYLQDIKLHCLKKNLNFFIKTEPVTAGAKNRTYEYTVASTPSVTGLGFMRRFRLFFWLNMYSSFLNMQILSIEFTKHKTRNKLSEYNQT